MRSRISKTNVWTFWAHCLTGPAALAFVPALCLAAFWIWGELALILVSLGLPLIMVLINPDMLTGQAVALRKVRGLIPRDDFLTVLDEMQLNARRQGHQSALFMLEVAEFATLCERHGRSAGETMVREIGARLEASLRDLDAIAQLGEHRFAICLAPMQHLDLEACLQLAGRYQTTVEEPLKIDGTVVYTSVAIGFCQLNRAPGPTGDAWFTAGEMALSDACRRGSTAIRAFSAEMHKIAAARISLRDDAQEALDSGAIQPWFQPQISTDTGRVTGFEALARWMHPERGLISPAEFLPVLDEEGLLDRLGEVMLYHTLTALKAWDAAGLDVPCVGVNFSGIELNNPKLMERIGWELDRFDITPERLCIEVLETVVSTAPGDTVARNVKALGDLGCKIDLDDFGTGNASLAAIRRFNVSRIKIDRSFVAKADRDPEQRRMIAAILTMAERLGIETLAEGVETVGEHALLAQLGCDHVQGFGIGRPMPFAQTVEWFHQHEAKLSETPKLPSKNAGDGRR